jgi:hypothetical protein
MRFVRIKSAEQQGQLMQHRTRDVLIRQRSQIINALRAHLAELGLVAAQGNAGVNELRAIVTDEQDTRLPIDARGMRIRTHFTILSTCLAVASGASAQDFKVTLLGTGVPFPVLDRFGAATLVEAGKERLLFDVGRGPRYG